jgi:prepilin-type N-terminal cleavage/methylation domain-containing protein
MKKNQKGFTLIELMIVVAIIGILAAIALPKFADMLEKSREGATKGNFTAIRSAINIYIGDQAGVNPTVLNNAATHVAGSTDVNFVKKYMDKIPPVKATAKSDVNGTAAGTGPGVGTEATTADVAHATWSGLAFASTGKGWKYDSMEGKLWVNSHLMDMTNKLYTVYGYE